MNSIEDLLDSLPARPGCTVDISDDPRIVKDVLQETQLVASRSHAFSGVAGLLFDLRTALQFDDGEAGLLVVHGLRGLEIRSTAQETGTTWVVMSSSPSTERGNFALQLEVHSNTFVKVAGGRAYFFTLRIPGISAAPPDLSEGMSRETVENLVTWSSPCSILQSFTG